ncbi:uncharacterized protein [Mytilus edulis]|uniref:uncharacterized protein n=1 Tax=Mytilus edulis TaxID=6550 RepID=UPI0039EFEF6E
MFRRIAMLVIQEQIRPTKFARKWRRKAKTKTELESKGETKLKCVKPKILTKSKSFITKGSAKLTTNTVSETLVPTVTTFNKSSSKSNTPRAPKKEKVKYSNEIFDDVMAEIKKYAKSSETKAQPDPIPNALVFDLGGSHASHEDVYHQLKCLLFSNKECRMKSLQYFPMSFRWIILLDSQKSRDVLAGSVIIVNGIRVTLRRYDDIIALEYKKSSRASGFIDTVKDY